MSDCHTIRSASLTATIAAHGAELQTVTLTSGEDLLWHGGPEWPRRAPVLFPIVGRLTEDMLIHQGKHYPLPKHGFARNSRFDWVERGESRCVLELRDSAATHASYPFAFRLLMIFEIDGLTLKVTTRVENPGQEVLPCGVGAHPAFRWPLVEGVPQESHRLDFEKDESIETYLIEDGLLGAKTPSPIKNRRLALSPELFVIDAIILEEVASRSVRFIAEDAQGKTLRVLDIAWEGYKDLGIWSRQGGAPFLCIEPWFSMCSPVGWQGEFSEKPGILLLEPQGVRDFSWRVTVG
ncbi:MAG: aldose epimerase [Rhizobiales bacterium PAR1]|nr:MAG: aldose epimerase [Rhizobiales bacterium PAR1]